MKIFRQLGNTGIECPRIIYGTSYLGNLYRELSEEEKLALMQEWFNVSDGMVMIDTAGKYGAGLALEVINRGLDKLGIIPSDILISNKLGWYRVPLETAEPTFEPGVWVNLKYDAVQKISYEGIISCWQQGNELLGGTHKADLVSVHDPDEYLMAATGDQDRKKRLNDILEAYHALFDLKAENKVKAVGIGSKEWTIIRELAEKVSFDWVMFANKFTLYHHPPEILRFMEEMDLAGVGIINSAVFNAGFLTGGAWFDYRKTDPADPADQPLFAWREKFFAVCRKYAIEPGDACLNFAVSAPWITAVALNPGKPQRMRHNKMVISEFLPHKFWEELKSAKIIDKYYPYV